MEPVFLLGLFLFLLVLWLQSCIDFEWSAPTSFFSPDLLLSVDDFVKLVRGFPSPVDSSAGPALSASFPCSAIRKQQCLYGTHSHRHHHSPSEQSRKQPSNALMSTHTVFQRERLPLWSTCSLGYVPLKGPCFSFPSLSVGFLCSATMNDQCI